MKTYGLIGYPLSHSFSKKFFSQKFSEEHIDARYELFELKNIEEFQELVKSTGLAGLNVTIPYKKEIIPYLDALDETAQNIGAVNVIKFIRRKNNLLLKGYNSDVTGFENSLLPLLQPHHTKALILGTGGASNAVRYVLNKHGIETKYVSRKKDKDNFTYDELDKEALSNYKLIVNTTPLGTYPKINDTPGIPYQFVTNKHFLYDLIYNPSETKFLQQGKKQGATILNGEQMLIGQAVAAWDIWNR